MKNEKEIMYIFFGVMLALMIGSFLSVKNNTTNCYDNDYFEEQFYEINNLYDNIYSTSDIQEQKKRTSELFEKITDYNNKSESCIGEWTAASPKHLDLTYLRSN